MTSVARRAAPARPPRRGGGGRRAGTATCGSGSPPRASRRGSELALSTKAGPVGSSATSAGCGAWPATFDVVHANFSHDHALARPRAWRERPTRVVRTVHSSRSLADRGHAGLGPPAHRRPAGRLRGPRGHPARALRGPRRAGGHRPRRRRLPTAFTPDGPDLRAELGIAPDAPVAGIVSRVKPDRRHAELVDAFRRVADRLPAARLVVVGRGEGLPDLRAHVERSGLADRVIFAGYRRGPELAAAYRTFDVKVLLAEGNDGTCRALLEGDGLRSPGRGLGLRRAGREHRARGDGPARPAGRRGRARRRHRRTSSRLPDRGRALGAAARERMRSLFTEEARGRAVEAFLERVRRMPPL